MEATTAYSSEKGGKCKNISKSYGTLFEKILRTESEGSLVQSTTKISTNFNWGK